MFIVGILVYACMASFGHYYIEGVGYSTIQDILSGTKLPLYMLLVLFALKLFATSLTLGSGGSGGIFSPSLFLGATLGGVYGGMLQQIFPGLAIDPAAFAVAGMAGMVSGVTGAAMTSVVMIFEMTLDYSVVLPMTVTVALSYGVRKLLSEESIYTKKLARRGHFIPESLRASPIHERCASDIMDTNFSLVQASLSLEEFMKEVQGKEPRKMNHLVTDGNKVIGLMTRETLMAHTRRHGTGDTVGDAAMKEYLAVSEKTSLLSLFAEIFSRETAFVMVLPQGTPLDAEHVRGIITKEHLAEFVTEASELFSPQ